MKNKRFLLTIVVALSFFSFSPLVHASPGNDAALILRGTAKTVGSVLQVPASMLADSTQVMFPFGLLTGAVKGTVRAVVGTVSGALDIARGGAPYAKYALLA